MDRALGWVVGIRLQKITILKINSSSTHNKNLLLVPLLPLPQLIHDPTITISKTKVKVDQMSEVIHTDAFGKNSNF